MRKVSMTDIIFVEHFVEWLLKTWENPEVAFSTVLSNFEHQLPQDKFNAILREHIDRAQAYLKQFDNPPKGE